MTENESPGGGWRRYQRFILAGVAAILAGVAVGWAISGAGGPATTTTAAATATTTPPSPTTTVAGTTPSTDVPGQLSLVPVEDTYVNEEVPEEINGLDDEIEVENDPPEVTRGLLRFNVAGIPEGETIRSAILRLFVVDDGEDAIGVHLVDGQWSQADTNASNAPAVGEQLTSIPAPGPEGVYVEVDLTSVVSAPGVYDFYLVSSGSDSIAFSSMENTENPPMLVVRWAEGPPPTAEESSTTTEPPATAAAPSQFSVEGEPAVLVGAGDIADCEGEADQTAALLDATFAEHPNAIVFTTGDNAYGEGTPEQFSQCYDPTWGRHKDRTRPSPGNHDYQTDGAGGYFGYFGSLAGPPELGYYSYEAGSWLVLSLNSNCSDIDGCDETSPQVRWLEAQLAASDANCTLAYWHSPLFSSGEHGNDDDVQDLFRVLYEHGAELVLAGHDHDYERFAPQDHNGVADPETGIRQIVVGTGGKSLRDFGQPAANSEVRYSDTPGVLEVTLYDDGYEWEFITPPGSGFTDTGSAPCH